MLPLKEATAEKHKIAERMPFNIKMFRGTLTKTEYLLYLSQQLQVFQTIESIGVPHPDLKRTDAVKQDINELVEQGFKADKILNGTKSYAEYLNSLKFEEVLPHIYLNYLAIMFGGQMMKKAVPSSGKMYEFENMQEALKAVRDVQKDEWAEEVNKAFDFVIRIFTELEQESNTLQPV